jgi:Transposase and inactivated derivatives
MMKIVENQLTSGQTDDKTAAYIQQLARDNDSLKNENVQLKGEVSHLSEVVRQYQKMIFGASSEKTKYIASEEIVEQISLFNEVETEACPEIKEPPTVVPAHTRKAKRTHEELAKDLPVVEVIHTLNEDECSCPKCGGELKPIGKTAVRDDIVREPAKYYIHRHMQESYICKDCGKDESKDAGLIDVESPTIIRAPVPKPVLAGSMVSASLLSYVLYTKYALALPLYRIEQDLRNNGVEISRATLANWVISSAERYLELLWYAMKAIVLSETVINADETPVQVLKEKDRSAKQKSYMWVFCSGEFSKNPAILYMYSTSRAGANAESFLGTYDKYLVTDGYAGYNGVVAKRCGCWAHLRRRFKDAMPPDTMLYEPEKLPPWRSKSENTKKERYASTAELLTEMKRQPVKSAVGFYLCNELFALEKLGVGKDNAELRCQIRRDYEKPFLDVFWEWIDSVNAAKGTSLSKAVNYALNEEKILMRFLDDPLIPISNNRAENSIRPFTLGRKNWLFSVSPKGAKSSAIVYSIIESAKANGLNPYQYLIWLFETMSQADKLETEFIASVLPWSTSVPDICKLEHNT